MPGSLLFMLGFVAIFALLASENALSKSKQFGAIETVASGRSGSGKRIVFFLAIAALLFGACGSFAGVAVSNAIAQ